LIDKCLFNIHYNLEIKLNVSIQLACVADEESGACSSIGVRYLLDKKLISGCGAIYVYPGTNVTIGHRGLLRLAIDVKGENVHTGSVEWNTKLKGANAVRLFVFVLYLTLSFFLLSNRQLL
jgi:acetylornithine deacetylase/succinyl-diaminopimelate desuccinylase-like protein